MSNEFNYSNNYDSVYGVDIAPKKKAGAKIALIAAGVLGVAAGGGAAAYNFSPLVKNQVKLRVCSPENYSTWVYSENTEDFAKQAADQYRAYIDKLNKGTTVDASVKFEPSAAMTDLIKEELGDNEKFKTLAETTDIALRVSSASKAGDSTGSIVLDRNGEALATIDFAVDETPFDLFFRLNELNEKWINIDEQSFGDSDSIVPRKQLRPEEVITPEEFEAEVKRYTDIWNKYTEDVTVEKKEDVAIEDITVSYTVITQTLTPEKIKEFKDAYISEMKNDELLRSILVDRLETVDSAEEYNKIFDDLLSEDNISFTTASIDTYVDPTGTVRGFRAVRDDETEFDLIYGISGDQVRGRLISDEATATLSATKNGSRYTGSLRTDVDDQIITIDFTDFERTGTNSPFFNADAVVRYENGRSDGDGNGGNNQQALTFKFTGTADSQTVVTDLVTNGTDYGKITMNIASSEGAVIGIPDKGAAFYLNDDASLDDYVTDDELDAFIDSFLGKLGISKEDTESLASDLLYGGMDYDDDDYDFDDYDFEDDDFDFDDDDFDFDEEDPDDSTSDVSDQELLDSSIPVNDGQVYLWAFSDGFDGNVYVDDDNKMRVAKGTSLADVNGPGTYVVSVSSETEDFARIAGGPAEELSGLWLIGENISGFDENTDIVIDKILIDGTEVTQEAENMCGPKRLLMILFSDENNGNEAIGKNWKNIEVTFTIK